MLSVHVGIGLAFVAMLCWGFGDFTMQKSTRKLGDWETLFVLTFFGAIVLLPFVYKDIPALLSHFDTNIKILFGSALIILIATLLTFEGFKYGKISVLEPLFSFEIPAASVLAFFILKDNVSLLQIATIIVLIIGLFLVSFREKSITKKIFIEKGVVIFFIGSVLMGFGDFFLGWGSRVTSPLLANFVLDAVMAIIALIFILARKQFVDMTHNIDSFKTLLLTMATLENGAWIAYSTSMSVAPIAIATGLSESSVIIAVLLGLFVNKEKLQKHQKIGLVISLVSIVFLAFITTK